MCQSGARYDYWPFSFVVELAPGDAEPDDGVDEELDAPDDGDVLDEAPPGLEVEPDVEPVPDDVEPADDPVDDGGVVVDDGGVVVDDEDEDGDGVTVGGDVDDVFDSR